MTSLTTIQPIRSIVLHIRSKDATQIDSNLNTNFEVDLLAPIAITPEEELHVFMSQAEIPYSFYCVSSDLNNNILKYDVDGTLTFPNQNYTPDELIRVMNDDTTFSSIFNTTYNRFTNKITITNNSGETKELNWTESTINKVLGFGSKTSDDSLSAGASSTSPDMVNLASVHSIMVHSSLSQANVLSTRSGNSTILQKISIDVNAYEIIYLNQDDFRTYSVSYQPVVDKISFRLTDQNNQLLNLNGINYEMSLIFNVYPKYTDRDANVLRQNIVQPPPTLVPNIQQPITREKTIDDTHPIEGKSEIEHDTQKVILDSLLDIQTQ
tara:strand:- start:52 stop:1023 length:972 start_codon:yes stop_codon:yes gene_type:complete